MSDVAAFWIGRNPASTRLPYWAFRRLAACAKADRDRDQIRLLEERAIGDVVAVAEPPAGSRMLDAAERCAVTQATAVADLQALIRARG